MKYIGLFGNWAGENERRGRGSKREQVHKMSFAHARAALVGALSFGRRRRLRDSTPVTAARACSSLASSLLVPALIFLVFLALSLSLVNTQARVVLEDVDIFLPNLWKCILTCADSSTA